MADSGQSNQSPWFPSASGDPGPPPFASGRLDRALYGAGLAVVVAVFGFRLFQFWGFTADDAYITLRHARNLVEGHGLVYNPGGPPVESFTSALMFLLQALFIATGLDPIGATKLLGALAGVATLLCSAALAHTLIAFSREELRVSRVVLLAGPFVAATSPILALGAVSGLETTLFVALLTASVWRLLALYTVSSSPRSGSVVTAGVLLGLTTWTRPEGIAWLAALGTMTLLACRRTRRPLAPVFWAVALGLLFWAALVAFRLYEFGRLHPNTYYAKMGAPVVERLFSGLRYARQWGVGSGGAVMLLTAGAGLLLLPARRRGPAVICFLLVVGQIFLAVYEGGDWIPHLRMMAPLTGVLAALTSLGFALITARVPLRRRYGTSIALSFLVMGAAHAGLRGELRQVFREVQTRVYGWNDAHRPLGEWLAKWQKQRLAAGRGPLTVALMDIGLVGWSAPQARILDLGGLADPAWARRIHRSGGKAPYPVQHLLVTIQPEVIVLVSLSPLGEQPVWWPGSDPLIHNHPEFRRRYVRVAAYAHKNFPHDSYVLHVFVRRPLERQAPPSDPPRPRTVTASAAPPGGRA